MTGNMDGMKIIINFKDACLFLMIFLNSDQKPTRHIPFYLASQFRTSALFIGLLVSIQILTLLLGNRYDNQRYVSFKKSQLR